MQNFCISYHCNVEDIFNPKFEICYDFAGVYNRKVLDSYTTDEQFLLYVKYIRETIQNDIEKIRNGYIKNLNNNHSLINELDNLLVTINNGCEYDHFHNNNFFFLTDNYLCFNNYENFIDELEWGSLGDEAESYETIVIIERNFKKFYFVRITRKLVSLAESATINFYYVKDGNIGKYKVNFKNAISINEYTDEGVEKILKLLN